MINQFLFYPRVEFLLRVVGGAAGDLCGIAKLAIENVINDELSRVKDGILTYQINIFVEIHLQRKTSLCSGKAKGDQYRLNCLVLKHNQISIHLIYGQYTKTKRRTKL